MKILAEAHFIQFYLWDYDSFQMSEHATGVLGANGAGKTSLGDGIQIALMGGHGQYLHFNAQSVQKDARSMRDYALGTIRGQGDDTVTRRKRDEALTYITIVFQGDKPEDVVSAGICFHSRIAERNHRVLGLYVLPGVHLGLEHHLETVDGDAKRPIAWNLFEAQARNMAAHAGRQPTITAKPESYIAELLHNLQHPGLQINTRNYLRALSHSINLKHVGSVGDFLRGYLVEAAAIDKQGTLRHMQSLRKLVAQIQEVKAQIVELEVIEKKQKALSKLLRDKVAAEAVRAQLRFETMDDAVAKLDDEIVRLQGCIDRREQQLNTLRDNLPALQKTYEELVGLLNADPEILQSKQAEAIHDAKVKTAQLQFREIERLQLSVRTALSSLYEAWERVAPAEAMAVAALADQWDGRAKRGEVAALSDAKNTLDLLQKADGLVEEQLATQARVLETAKSRLVAVTGKISASQKGYLISDDGVATAMGAFEAEGIGSQPVGSLVTVTAPDWQGAIESFFGRNRFALVVDAGKEREAVRILRSRRIPEVTVVQPEHLKDAIGNVPPSKSVAALLKGENSVALAYLRRILGSMLQVETEEELERHGRALTRDYMLSANGGTKRIRELPASEWMLGVQVSPDDRKRLKDEFLTANDAKDKAAQNHDLLKAAGERIRAATREINFEHFSDAVTAYLSGKAEAEAARPADAATLSERLKGLSAKVEVARAGVTTAEQEISKLNYAQGGDSTALETKLTLKTDNQLKLGEYEAVLDVVRSGEDYDLEQESKLYSECFDAVTTNPETGLTDVMTRLTNQISAADSKAPQLEANVRVDFSAFADSRSLGLPEERSNWRRAAVWVVDRIDILNNSTLGEYEQEAKTAREAAEIAFQSDVKFKIREACNQVKISVNDLNRILSSCPAFTGGEKYRFTHDPSPAHADLLKIIMDTSLDFQSNALFANEAVQKQVADLLDNCQSGNDKGNNPFEDYRLFYNFDLEIVVGGKVVDLLSRRMGVASNGEHRVPFYVIAGAALANAYRIKEPVTHKGAGLMILDEAFYGMDAQNSYATAEFLRGLGLQLILAGPDTDQGKLLPVLESYYEIIRPENGTDTFIDHVVVKEAARRMMLSDMPDRNPQLIEQLAAQIALDMA